MIRWLVPLFFLFLLVPAEAQQRADDSAAISVAQPTWPEGRGPTIFLDHAHNNFHRIDGKFAPFAALARADGFAVIAWEEKFTDASLKDIKILVIANALHPSSVDHWVLPTASAFTQDEIRAIKRWVRRGGALFLIADHMPFAGAAADLAAAFGFTFANGFALIPARKGAPDVFAGASLNPHPILSGREATERVNRVATFIGSAFQAPPQAAPLILLDDRFVSLEPQVAWQFDDATPRHPLAGWLQAATRGYGKGRLAVYGEAAMLSAQIDSDGHSKMGFNAPEAPENKQFVLNTLHWLVGLLPLK